MSGKINGSLTVSKVHGKNTCTVESLFIDKSELDDDTPKKTD